MHQDKRQTLRIETCATMAWAGFDHFPTLHELQAEFGKNSAAQHMAALDQQINSALHQIDDWAVKSALQLIAAKCERIASSLDQPEAEERQRYSINLSHGGLNIIGEAAEHSVFPNVAFLGVTLELADGSLIWLCATSPGPGRLRFEEIYLDGERALSRFLLNQSFSQSVNQSLNQFGPVQSPSAAQV